MPACQTLLFPDPKPLVERLGREFFRQLPEKPGVYFMRNAAREVLYIGKAKNLRKRLGSYRVANPDCMPRRHLRLLRAVISIEFELCPDESAALARESELLRTLKPKYNRAGTWPSHPRYLLWRQTEANLELAVMETAGTEWRSQGPFGREAFNVQAALARLIWIALHPEHGIGGLPIGWFHGRVGTQTTLPCGSAIQTVVLNIENLLSGQTHEFTEWIRSLLTNDLPPFSQAVVEADLELLSEFFFTV